MMNRWIPGRSGEGEPAPAAIAAQICGVLVRWLIFCLQQWLG
jgi:hypothetical protein